MHALSAMFNISILITEIKWELQMGGGGGEWNDFGQYHGDKYCNMTLPDLIGCAAIRILKILIFNKERI